MTSHTLFSQEYLKTYQIFLESGKPPKNGRRSLLNSPKYPRKNLMKKEWEPWVVVVVTVVVVRGRGDGGRGDGSEGGSVKRNIRYGTNVRL